MVTPELKAFYEEQGYVVAPRVFTADEVAYYIDYYMRLREAGTYPNDLVSEVPREGDPLQRYPRMSNMHWWDEVSRRWLLEPRLNECLTALLGAEPIAAQTMIYFKPPGARGQALHQDNYYLQVRPGTCMAAWMALDDCDVENGCMHVVPGSHRWDILCSIPSDGDASFTHITVPLPENAQAVPVRMKAGDVLFFAGALVHGSMRNITSHRFRRSLVGHYVEANTIEMAHFDLPAIHMDGSPAALQPSPGGGPCGGWETVDGELTMIQQGSLPVPRPEDFQAVAERSGTQG